MENIFAGEIMQSIDFDLIESYLITFTFFLVMKRSFDRLVISILRAHLEAAWPGPVCPYNTCVGVRGSPVASRLHLASDRG